MKARALALIVLAVLTACGGSAPVAEQPAERARVDRSLIPARIFGLRTAPENVSSVLEEAADRAFVTDVRMWSLREGKRLRATLELGRFTDDASPDDDGFRRAMSAQLGAAQARLRRIDETLVWVAPGNSQTLFLWFGDVNFGLLGVSTEYKLPRALLRATLEAVRV